jgi:hypothetical protein
MSVTESTAQRSQVRKPLTYQHLQVIFVATIVHLANGNDAFRAAP